MGAVVESEVAEDLVEAVVRVVTRGDIMMPTTVDTEAVGVAVEMAATEAMAAPEAMEETVATSRYTTSIKALDLLAQT